MQYKIPHRIHAEKRDQILRIDHIAFGLAHLTVPLQQPGMAEHLLRQLFLQRHQEDGPVDRMEADDILADQMKVRRPQLLILLRGITLRIIADTRDIVGQRV